jgi:tRNA pseudouridine55 synthase
MTKGEPSGVLVFDKPRGCTSHDVVARVRRTLGTRAVGHAGTLDPMATGVLVVMVGEATKLAPWLTAQHKGYEATVALGVETDTLDADGRESKREALSPELCEALRQSAGLRTTASLLESALDVERRRASQLPPVYSAIQSGGERAYAQARRGEAPTLATRPVRVSRLELTACCDAPPTLSVSLDVSKGYYVRALARDLANTLGTVGHLTSLRRLKSGSFGLGEALAIDADAGEMTARMSALSAAASRALPLGRLTAAGADDARHGRRVAPDAISAPSSGPSAWIDALGELVAVGELEDDGGGRVIRGFSATSSAPPPPVEPLPERP